MPFLHSGLSNAVVWVLVTGRGSEQKALKKYDNKMRKKKKPQVKPEELKYAHMHENLQTFCFCCNLSM